ncbi:MAG: phosphotransferase [Acidimicrobiales bacterium]|jgi:hypothetical protein
MMYPVREQAVPGRTVTLVVARGDRILGAMPPFDVETPWWVDIKPIAERHPDIAVLRLLKAEPPPGFTMGGKVTYLVEPLETDTARAGLGDRVFGGLRHWTGSVTADPLRMPWAQPGGPATDLTWAATHIRITGPPVQHRTWNLSAIWCLPTDDGRIWMKCVPPFFRHEPAVLGLLAERRVPSLVATDGQRMLLEELPGEDGYGAPLEARQRLIDLLIDLQMSTVDRIGELEAVGVPDRRWPALVEASEAVVLRRAPGNTILRELIDRATERVAAIDECGLPSVLVHGDAHPGNARVGPGADPGIWFDWGDSGIGHPMLDVVVLLRSGTEHADSLFARWLDGWKNAVPGSDPHRAWRLIKPLAALGEAVVYQGFLDNIEAAEQPYHVNDVMPCLARAAALALAPD